MKLYDSLTSKEFSIYVQASGFGIAYPHDLSIWEKYLTLKGNILEVGCGNGRIGKHLVKKDVSYTGIDISKNMLDQWDVSDRGEGMIYISSFFDLIENVYDIILFPYSFLCDFDTNTQLSILVKAYQLLAPNGIVLLDNPAKDAVKNLPTGHTLTMFYIDDWREDISKIGFSIQREITYTTLTDRKRELLILKKS